MSSAIDIPISGARSLIIDDDVVSAAEAAELAAASYYEAGFHCAESVVKAVNEVLGHPMPPEVFKMASGFCEGLGGSRCICGALAGGVMAIGLTGGRLDADDAWEPSYEGAAELRRRWVEDQDAESCDEVVKRIGGMHLPERWAHCTMLVGRTARWVVEIAEEPPRG
ncbi:MAG: C-GCAxxG-C-C family protein [Coriobacteriia bacterium]|nr:C-GCAxxG-C-C family protein [Coriobacteriia bacterium]